MLSTSSRTPSLFLGAAALGLLAVLIGSDSAADKGASTPAQSADLPQCDAAGTTSRPLTEAGDPKVRAAAQKGLDFLARSTVEWQGSHQCYGCHVQAVTLKAMAVGQHHDYTVQPAALTTVTKA